MDKALMVRRLKEAGLKVTPQRLAILEVFEANRNLHPGARFLYEQAKKKRKRLSLSTTYATLNELSRHGIIKILQFDRMENRYEGNLHEHLNLICETCGTILDYKAPILVDQKDVTHKTGFSVRETRLEYYGHCRECRKKTKGRGHTPIE
jgi:Fe2+ or Zn2+ uptake regulation protein